MNCPYCGHEESRVVNSRSSDDGSAIRRRRECQSCVRRFTTYERAQLEPLMVVKRGGVRQAFNPDKLLRGLLLASEKRPIPESTLRAFAYSFEDEVGAPEIASNEIGLRAMNFLRPLDDVAYIRFASVYREFDSLEHFLKEIQGLKNQDDPSGTPGGPQATTPPGES